MICLTIVLIALIAALFYVYFTWNFDYWKKRGVEGPKPKPFIGSYPGMFSKTTHMVDDYERIYRSYKDKERFVGVFNLRDPQLLITDPKLGRDILVANFKNFHDNTLSKLVNREQDPLFSEHPFIISGADWKTTRQMISPALAGNRLKAYYPIILQTCEKLKKHLSKVCKSPPKEGVDAKELSKMFTLDIIAAGIYDVDSENFTDKHPTEMFKITEGLFNQNLFFLFYSTLISMFPKLMSVFHVSFFDYKVGKYFTKVLDQSAKRKEKSGVLGQDFLSFLMELEKRNPMTRSKMTAHTMSFLIDGFDTTACLITNVLLYIARNPEVQEKIIQESEDNIDENGSPTLETINDLKYLDAVFHEAYRVLPPVLFYSKICTEKIEIERKDGSKFLIEEGVECVIPNLSYQKDEHYFENPDVFDDERLIEDGVLKKLKNEGLLMPFGDGPRACMGMRLATLELKAFLIETVRNFKVSVNKKTRIDNKIDPNLFIGCLDGGVWLDFEPRKKDL
ncbi:hypothetical protein ACFFRR_007943 [Megaselia abdita]